MKEGNLGAVITILIGLLIGLWVVVDILTGEANKLGGLFLWLTASNCLIGLIAPRAAIYLAILSTAYIDHFKRLMVIDVNISFTDLYYVLGFTPVLVGSCFVSLIARWIFGEIRITPAQKRLFLVCCAVMAVNLLSLFGMGSWTGGVLAGAANMVVYNTLIFTLPVLFPDPKSVDRLIRFVCIAFIPCVLYMFKQAWWGLADFEIAYLETGFSLEQRIFGDKVLRLFSTMNSAANYSTVVSMLAISWIAPRITSAKVMFGIRLHPGAWIMCLLFLWSSVYTFSRGGWMCALAMVAGLVFFRYRRSGIALLAGMFAAVLTLAVLADYIEKHDLLARASEVLVGDSNSAEAHMAGRLGTFGGRLKSMNLTLTVPERWTPFGVWAKGMDSKAIGDLERYTIGLGKTHTYGYSQYYSHDGFSDLLLRIGYVPMLISIVGGIWILLRLFKYVELARLQPEGRVFILGLAAVMGALTGYVANAEQIRTFPVNFYLYFFVGVLAVGYGHLRELRLRSLQVDGVSCGDTVDAPDAIAQGLPEPSRH